MPQARKNQININDTPYYHCMGRCVRRAFLCGEDELTGKDYSHRKQWVIDKLVELSQTFCIDVCAYAVMSNHYHLVLKVNTEQASSLSDKEVINRWLLIFGANTLIQRYINNEKLLSAELDKVQEIINLWRERLSDISWFMRCLNESIARLANAEDKCTGRFWEGRFKSQALLNQQALLSCMAYVDLNPIRAGLAQSLDESEFTSIEQRIKKVNQDLRTEKKQSQDIPLNQVKLANFIGGQRGDGIAYTLMDYLELVDWSGRAIRHDKSGYIKPNEPRILKKLGFDKDSWIKALEHYSEHFYSHLGSEKQLKRVCEHSGKKWLAGIRSCRKLFY